MAAVGPQQHGAEHVPTIYHTTLTNRHTQNRAHKSPMGPGSEKSSVTCFNALCAGTVATDLSDFESAELNDVDSQLSTVTRMGACEESDIWRIIDADDEPDDTYFRGSRPNEQVRAISDLDFHEVRPLRNL